MVIQIAGVVQIASVVRHGGLPRDDFPGNDLILLLKRKV
jgi:hypothetical protein